MPIGTAYKVAGKLVKKLGLKSGLQDTAKKSKSKKKRVSVGGPTGSYFGTRAYKQKLDKASKQK